MVIIICMVNEGKERSLWHGGADLRKALGLDNSKTDFKGKEVLLAGLLDQWKPIVQELQSKGANVTSVGVDSVAGPKKKFTHKSPELQKEYDIIALPMVPAFYKRFTGARNALLKKTVE